MKRLLGVVLVVLGAIISLWCLLIIIRTVARFGYVIASLQAGDPSQLLAFLHRRSDEPGHRIITVANMVLTGPIINDSIVLKVANRRVSNSRLSRGYEDGKK